MNKHSSYNLDSIDVCQFYFMKNFMMYRAQSKIINVFTKVGQFLIFCMFKFFRLGFKEVGWKLLEAIWRSLENFWQKSLELTQSKRADSIHGIALSFLACRHLS